MLTLLQSCSVRRCAGFVPGGSGSDVGAMISRRSCRKYREALPQALFMRYPGPLQETAQLQ